MAKITDIKVACNNWIQDASNTIFNASVLYFDDGTSREATDADDIEWWWERVYPINGATVPLGNSFHLNAGETNGLLCSGIFVLQLKARDITKRVWGRAFPVFWQPSQVSVDQCDMPMPLPGALSAVQWAEQVGLHMNLAPHIFGSNFIKHKDGDLNGDGAVNVADLLVLTGNYGQ